MKCLGEVTHAAARLAKLPVMLSRAVARLADVVVFVVELLGVWLIRARRFSFEVLH
jgi:hypothetical protein